MMNLAERDFVPVKEMTGPVIGDELESLSRQLSPGWQVVDGHHLEKRFEFADFGAALEFVDDVADLAEDVDHHPDICFGWGYCQITIWTHKIGGLSVNDFIFAARSEELPTHGS
jgi:4a-hydroxytetrahydrobiopterin dehydratase